MTIRHRICKYKKVMLKTYQIKDTFSEKKAIRFTVDGKSKTIVFESRRKNGILTAEVADEKTQQAIESTDKFISKQITISSSRPVPGIPTEQENMTLDHLEGTEGTSYPDVTTFSKAREILTGEPYNLAKTSTRLKNAEAILATAAELNVSVPALSNAE